MKIMHLINLPDSIRVINNPPLTGQKLIFLILLEPPNQSLLVQIKPQTVTLVIIIDFHEILFILQIPLLYGRYLEVGYVEEVVADLVLDENSVAGVLGLVEVVGGELYVFQEVCGDLDV